MRTASEIVDWLGPKHHLEAYLEELPMMELGAICQALGHSGRGSRPELTAKIIRIVRHTQALRRIKEGK